MSSEILQQKLKTLPNSPGVYFHKNSKGEIIYVGKAAVLKNRVRQYFRSQQDMDIKTQALVAEIADTDWVQTESEIDALFLESEMVKRYMPQYNILLRDGKSQLFVRINLNDELPFVSFTRQPSDDGARYIGPFFSGFAVKKALRYLRKIFPYYIKNPEANTTSRADLDVHLGLSPGVEFGKMTAPEYKRNLRKLIKYIEGDGAAIIKEIERDMKTAARLHEFEKAAQLRNKLQYFSELKRRICFGDKEFLDISKDRALSDLTALLGLKKIPKRIEGYDISHMSGTNVVASMVVFANGVSDRASYRKFKTRVEHNNDFYNMNETISRRLSEKNLTAWGVPDLLLIDGGKGQLDAALQARDSLGKYSLPFIGLAKREEKIVIHHQKSCVTIDEKILEKLEGFRESSQDFTLINLPKNSHIIKLLQRIRDESHRFAVSYHTVLKRAGATKNILENIPGFGPKTRAKLLKKFGSIAGISRSSDSEIIAVIGVKKMQELQKYLPKKGNSR